MKVEQASSPKTSKSSAIVIPKGSMFGAKFGFVIPKNKLSGSLVPTLRGASKYGKIDPVTDVNTEQAQRKTKWGPDLTQDAFVRKARLLAYQTRVDQITQQIETKNMETEVGQDSDMRSPNTNQESSHHILNAEELEKLKLEKREIIGEILKLNPSYKTPPDYVPLLKENRVPLPIKDYPGYNFLGLIYGSGRDTLKRLEKETGAKIHVFGKKRDSAEKVEITPDDMKNQDDYDELYALVSADTYDKVDAAVALVELLVTPVSAPSSKMSNIDTPILDQSSDDPSEVPKATEAAVVQSLERPTQIFQGQFQHNNHTLEPSNSAQLLSSQLKPEGMAPAVSSGLPISGPPPFPSVLQPQMQFPSQPNLSHSHNFGQPDRLRHPPLMASHMIPSQSNISTVHQFSESQPIPMGMSSMVRSLGTSWPQPALDHPVRSQLNQEGSFTSWPKPQAPTLNSSMTGITNATALGHQNNTFGMAGTTNLPVQNQQNLRFGAAQTVPFLSRPVASLLPSNMNQGVTLNTFGPPPPVRPYSASPQGPSPAFRPGAALTLLHQPSFLPARSVAGGAQRVPFDNSGGFVFQSQPQQNPAAPMNPWQGSTLQNSPPPNLSVQKPLDIRGPYFLPNCQNQPQRPFFGDSFRPHPGDRFDMFQSHFTEHNPSSVFPKPTIPPFSHGNFGMHEAPFLIMGEMNIGRFRPRSNVHDPFLPRPGNDSLSHAHPVRNPLNHNPTGRPSYMHSRGQQAYDPFSPTPGATGHQPLQVRNHVQVKD